MARDIANEGWSVREVERRVGEQLKKASPAVRRTARKDRDVARLEEELSNRLGTAVQIKPGPRKGSGQLVIAYRTLEQLDAVLARLK